ncbi:hypothetical protein IW261DRAFT_944606 [Armillaria novae-zelandiae]|uniref:Uncharacterized protein n=1 Tax=Armillaria novae-zelandiae TaxID=153914 RepID=A0AA39PFN2_9AGAR|nr:hypothetical protein IW261DRAFT_944606 [Armillaria novae-zelandiae]
MRTFVVPFRVIRLEMYVFTCLVSLAMIALLIVSIVAGSVGIPEDVLFVLDGLPFLVLQVSACCGYKFEIVSMVRHMTTLGVLFVVTLASAIFTTILHAQGYLVQNFAALPNSKSLAIALVVLSWVSPPAAVIGFIVSYKEYKQPQPPRVWGAIYSSEENLSRTHSMELGHITTEYKIGSFATWDPSRIHRTVIPRVQLEPNCRIPEPEQWTTLALD